MELKDLIREAPSKTLRDEFQKIKDAHPEGLLTAESVVEAARDDDSPLHKFFTWDDDRAAVQWRLVEARSLIRHVKISISNGKDSTSAPKYVSLQIDRTREGGGYRETADVTSDPELLAELESTAKAELASWSRRHEILTDLVSRVRKAAKLPAPKGRHAKARRGT